MKKLTTMAICMMAGSLFFFQGRAQNTFPSSGNAGIGTTSPTSPLDIRSGGATPGGPSMALSAVSTSSLSTFWACLGVTATQTAANTQGIAALGITGVGSNPSGTNINLVFGAEIAALQNGAGTSSELRAYDGDVQMGATAGNVTNAECFYAHSVILNSPTTTGHIQNGYGFFLAPFTSNVVTKYGVYINDSSASNYFGGTMTIGTRTVPPGYALAVNGSAIFTKAVVQTFSTWPDYVFKKGYPLQPLDSLAAYIGANSHLPEVPSAGEVKDKGLDIGSSEAVLLKKIEELTLYMIRQNDELKMQGQLLKSQQAKMKAMQRKLAALTHS